MKRKFRNLVADGHDFVWHTRWTYDRDGERILHLIAFHASGARKRGQPLHARFVGSEAAYPEDTSAVLPGDARAAIDLARARGWTGEQAHWLLPNAGLVRPGITLAAPTRLREWADDAQLYHLYLHNVPVDVFSTGLAALLEIPVNPATVGAAEVQWVDPRYFLLRSRFGGVTLYARSVALLVVALAAARTCAPGVTASLGARPAQIHGPGASQLPADRVTPLEHWATVPGATRHAGPRATDAIWVVRGPDDLHVEFYMYHHDAPTRLWLWTTLRDGVPAVERRFAV